MKVVSVCQSVWQMWIVLILLQFPPSGLHFLIWVASLLPVCPWRCNLCWVQSMLQTSCNFYNPLTGLLRVFLMRALSKNHAMFCTRSQRMIRNTLMNTKIFTSINIFQNILTNFQMHRETNSIGCTLFKCWQREI